MMKNHRVIKRMHLCNSLLSICEREPTVLVRKRTERSVVILLSLRTVVYHKKYLSIIFYLPVSAS